MEVMSAVFLIVAMGGYSDSKEDAMTSVLMARVRGSTRHL